jgi:hypothetical protein
LRNISEFKEGKRKLEECISEKLVKGKTYDFLKRGQRNYWLLGELPLLETRGNQVPSRPKAAVVIVECTHFVENQEVWTRGKFKVIEVFTGPRVRFESYARVK